MTAEFIAAFVTLFVTIDPVGMTPMFVALTSGMELAQRQAIARRASLIAGGILLVFGLFGTAVLGALGISLEAFRISGGLLLFLIAVDMLFERRTKRREDKSSPEGDQDPSVFPLATPLVAGPGALAAMVLLTSSGEGWTGNAIAYVALAANIAIVFALFRLASPIERLLGRTGIVVVTRLLGMLLAALAVQFVLDGLASVGLFTGGGEMTPELWRLN